MATLNKTVRDTAAKMAQPQNTLGRAGQAERVSVEKAKGGFISSTEYKGANNGIHYNSPVKAVHKNLASVKQHMAHAFNTDDADEA